MIRMSFLSTGLVSQNQTRIATGFSILFLGPERGQVSEINKVYFYMFDIKNKQGIDVQEKLICSRNTHRETKKFIKFIPFFTIHIIQMGFDKL